MSIARINIDQQLGAVGIETTPAKMKISMPKLTMHVKTELPKMSIDREAPTFKVDRKRINSETGYKQIGELTREYSEKGKKGALEGAKNSVSEGNFLGDTRQKGDRVAQLARNKTMSAILKKQEMNLGLMPKSVPELSWDKGHMRVNWSKHSLVIDWEGEYLPQVTIEPPYSVEVFLRTKPYFRLTVEEGEDPGQPGKLIDELM